MSSFQVLRVVSRMRPRNHIQFQLLPSRLPVVRRAPLATNSTSFTSDRDQDRDQSKEVAAKSGSGHAAKMGHENETFDEFTARYEKEFEGVQDVFELQRNLNNSFAYDLVPSPIIIIAALRAARRVNDYPTAVRIFEGIKAKVENKGQYDEYIRELAPIREELGVNLFEDLYPEGWPWVDAGVWV